MSSRREDAGRAAPGTGREARTRARPHQIQNRKSRQDGACTLHPRAPPPPPPRSSPRLAAAAGTGNREQCADELTDTASIYPAPCPSQGLPAAQTCRSRGAGAGVCKVTPHAAGSLPRPFLPTSKGGAAVETNDQTAPHLPSKGVVVREAAWQNRAPSHGLWTAGRCRLSQCYSAEQDSPKTTNFLDQFFSVQLKQNNISCISVSDVSVSHARV